MSFTNHAYFNLSGNIDYNILDHKLYINSDYYMKLDKNMIPITKASLDHTPFDFRNMKTIGKDINLRDEQLNIASGYDHPYLINKNGDINHVATLTSPLSNLVLEVFSDQDALVLYTGNFIDNAFILNNGLKGAKNCALALETHGIPNSLIHNIYDAFETYKQTTIWKLHK